MIFEDAFYSINKLTVVNSILNNIYTCVMSIRAFSVFFLEHTDLRIISESWEPSNLGFWQLFVFRLSPKLIKVK